MKLKNKKIAFGLTNAFYAFKATIAELSNIAIEGGEIFPIMSKDTYLVNNKFGNILDYASKIEEIAKRKIITSREEAERVEADIMVIAPCSRK